MNLIDFFSHLINRTSRTTFAAIWVMAFSLMVLLVNSTVSAEMFSWISSVNLFFGFLSTGAVMAIIFDRFFSHALLAVLAMVMSPLCYLIFALVFDFVEVESLIIFSVAVVAISFFPLGVWGNSLSSRRKSLVVSAFGFLQVLFAAYLLFKELGVNEESLMISYMILITVAFCYLTVYLVLVPRDKENQILAYDNKLWAQIAGNIDVYGFLLDYKKAEFVWERGLYNVFDLSVPTKIGFEQLQDLLDEENINWLKESLVKLSAKPNAEEHNELKVKINTVRGEKWLSLKTMRSKDYPNCILGAVRDVTNEHQILDQYERVSALKDKILASVAHDLSGPLNRIEGLSELVGMSFRTDRINTQKYLDLISQNATKGQELIRELLTHSEFEEGLVILEEKIVDLRAFVNESAYLHQEEMRKHGLILRIELPTHPVFCAIDVSKMGRVIDNLLTNAIKFTPGGGKVKMSLSLDEKEVVLSIQDTGIGIPEELLPVLFDRFTEAGRKGLLGQKSTGLGMSIVKQVVDLHNGTIQVDSLQGQGTNFQIKLPLQEQIESVADTKQAISLIG